MPNLIVNLPSVTYSCRSQWHNCNQPLLISIPHQPLKQDSYATTATHRNNIYMAHSVISLPVTSTCRLLWYAVQLGNNLASVGKNTPVELYVLHMLTNKLVAMDVS
ncbi:hypothetical protein BsWGS_04109 [Bradybaena similaris]